MTRKHYEEIAEELHKIYTRRTDGFVLMLDVVSILSSVFRKENVRFDRIEFKKAVYKE